MQVIQALAPVIDLVFPPRCPLCGGAIRAQTGLCASCWSTLEIPGDPACRSCSRPMPDDAGPDALCLPCLAAPPAHDGIVAATLYNESSRKLVLGLKHGRKLALARLTGALLAARLPQLEEGLLLVPVPLHRWRLWRRGYNQAAEIARELARRTPSRLVVDGLLRRKRTPSLGSLGKAARKRALQGAIAVNPHKSGLIRGASIVLVDDVLTSGATSDACVRALRRAGAERIVVACFARVIEGTAHQAGRSNDKTPGINDPGRPRDEMAEPCFRNVAVP